MEVSCFDFFFCLEKDFGGFGIGDFFDFKGDFAVLHDVGEEELDEGTSREPKIFCHDHRVFFEFFADADL